MGNRPPTYLQSAIDATKQDISQDYDLSTIDGVVQANKELIRCFSNSNYHKHEVDHVKKQLFTLTRVDTCMYPL